MGAGKLTLWCAAANKICLSFTGFHEEQWQPAWGIRTALLGIQSFMGSKGEEHGYGTLNLQPDERQRFAEQCVSANRSRSWRCSVCELSNEELITQVDDNAAAQTSADAVKEEPAKEMPSEPETHTHTEAVALSSTTRTDTVTHTATAVSTSVSTASETQGFNPVSVAGMHAVRVESCRRMLNAIDATMSIIGVLLALLVLNCMII